MLTYDYWNTPSKLVRGGGGIAFAPEPVMWSDPGLASQGSLARMVSNFLALPQEHRPYYAIVTHEGHYLRSRDILSLSRQPDFPRA